MSLTRIKSIIIQELYITRNSLEVIIDLFYFSIVTVIVFGFVSLYLAGAKNTQAASFILMGMILWEIIRVTQYSVSVGSLWNIWSRNLSNMFVSPLTLQEYMIAEIIAGAVKTIVVLICISIISYFVFNFNILRSGLPNIILFFVNLTIFSWSVGITVLGLIFRFGTRIQALAWGIVFLFQPLTAAFFPVSILPGFMRTIAYALPPTYIFEAARKSISNPSVDWTMIGISFFENIVYLLIGVWFFNKMFNKSRETGQFAKNEG